MRNGKAVWRSWRIALTIVPMLAVMAVLAPGGPLAGGKDVVEMPMQVQTEGMTYGEYLQRQADLNARLLKNLPERALGAIRVDLTQDEILGVERAPRISGTPLQIGLVKGVTPRYDVDGLLIDRGAAAPRRGPGAFATPTADGGAVWAVAVVSASAGALRVHVENMSLPPGAELYFYSRIGEAFGPYRGLGPNGDGDFWTDTVFGIEGILQLHLPAPARQADLDRVSLTVTEAGVILPRFAGSFTPAAPPPRPPSFCGNPSCIVDASCFTGTPADPAKLAVAKIEWIQGAFIYTCTGGLIADNNPTQSNFFLTANHCISKNNTASNAQFYWRFATSSCNGSCPSNSGWPYLTMGSTVSATGRKGDFTLLHLNANPPSGSTLLGWTSAPVANVNGAHLYRISNPNFGPQVYSQHDVDTSAPTCSGWPRGERIYSRDITGAIDGGSSGSPVVNASSQIVGQLSGICGTNVNNPCDPQANATVDGAFAFYFSTVQPILNP